MIENTEGHLREISTNFGECYGDYEGLSLVLISTIYKKCPLIERLSLEFPLTRKHLIEFERLLKRCQKLKVLLLNVQDEYDGINGGSELLRILSRSAPNNLREIRLHDYAFFEKWRGRHSLSILACAYGRNGTMSN